VGGREAELSGEDHEARRGDEGLRLSVVAGPLRILFVSREYPPETGGGGIGSYVQTVARALARRGHEVHVLSCVDGQPADDREDSGVHVHRRGAPRVLPKVRRRVPWTALRIEGAIARYREARRLGVEFDVVEAPDWFAEGLAFSLLKPRPLVAHLHTPFGLVGRNDPGSSRPSRDGKLADRVERFAVRHADVVTSPSRLLARDLAREGWLGSHEPRIVRYPVDVGPWTGLEGAEESPPRVLAVGRLEGRKAPEVLVRAAATLARDVPGLEVVFVGRSSLRNGAPYGDWLRDQARRLGAPCRFVEEVPREELPGWYGASRVVAVASRYDNFPYAALEAMASERPVVCTERTGTAEIVAGTDAGSVVAVDDPAALADALRPFLLDPSAAGRSGRAARSVVERECSPDGTAAEREACYREALRVWAGKRV
jgi:glycogen(starch) synthase